MNRAFRVTSTDGGRTWPMLAEVLSVEVPAAPGANVAQTVHGSPLAIDPLDSEILYAGGLGVLKSVDGGITWRRMGLTRGPVLALAVDPQEPKVVYAGTDAGLFKSTDAGASWQSLQGALEGVRVETLALDPEHQQTLYAGTDRGVYWSTDGGSRCRRFTRLPLRTYGALAVDRSAGVLHAGADGGGIYELQLAR